MASGRAFGLVVPFGTATGLLLWFAARLTWRFLRSPGQTIAAWQPKAVATFKEKERAVADGARQERDADATPLWKRHAERVGIALGTFWLLVAVVIFPREIGMEIGRILTLLWTVVAIALATSAALIPSWWDKAVMVLVVPWLLYNVASWTQRNAVQHEKARKDIKRLRREVALLKRAVERGQHR